MSFVFVYLSYKLDETGLFILCFSALATGNCTTFCANTGLAVQCQCTLCKSVEHQAGTPLVDWPVCGCIGDKGQKVANSPKMLTKSYKGYIVANFLQMFTKSYKGYWPFQMFARTQTGNMRAHPSNDAMTSFIISAPAIFGIPLCNWKYILHSAKICAQNI